MELILFGLAAVGAWSLFKANTARGLRTVRCYVYHTALDDGASPEEANQRANSISTDVDTTVILDAKRYVALCFGGKQLAMIGAAKVRGFIEYQSIDNPYINQGEK
jgi:hypothetical protein